MLFIFFPIPCIHHIEQNTGLFLLSQTHLFYFFHTKRKEHTTKNTLYKIEGILCFRSERLKMTVVKDVLFNEVFAHQNVCAQYLKHVLKCFFFKST